MKHSLALLALLLVTAAAPACDSSVVARESAPALVTASPSPVQTVRIVRTFPHDPGAFTQGLLYRDGALYESTGLEGQSTIRQVRLKDGKVLRSVRLPPTLFGEGLVDWKNQLISVTWRSGLGFRWRLSDFRKLGEFRYEGEGWGLTRDAEHIILSDGTPVLRFLDPVTMKERRRLTVTHAGRPVRFLNELEWVKNEIFANVWMTNVIVRIDPASGKVVGRIDLSPLADPNRSPENVLNGIAYDAAGDRLFVTGKNWTSLYEIALQPPR